MLILLNLIFVFAFCILLLRSGKDSKYFKFLSILPFKLFLYFLSFLPEVQNSGAVLLKNNWIPSMGVSLDFKLDGLSLLFSLLITGIGTLVFLYASSYLNRHIYLNRFYCYLTAFMGAMLGVVLSDNLITLFIFWELTSISSFFLIGFNNEDEEIGRASCRERV